MARNLKIRDERFRVLWTLLRWQGEVRPRQLKEIFGLQSVQASRLIAEFREVAPDVMAFDTGSKSWRLANAALPEKCGGELDEFLRILDVAHPEHPTWFEDGRARFMDPPADRFRLIREACEQGLGVEMTYSSMTQELPLRRVIYPHAVIRLTQRWHIRGWCVKRLEYRDFNFGRMSNLELVDEPPPAMPADDNWNTFVSLRICPHRDLLPNQHDAVRGEFCSGAAARKLKVRGALVPYTLNDARIATDPSVQKPPEFLLELMNLKDVKQFLFTPAGPG